MTADFRRGLRDLADAVSVGMAAELTLAAVAVHHCCDTAQDFPWPRILEEPGAGRSLRLFGPSGFLRRYGGAFDVLLLAILLQALVFSLVALGSTYLLRMFIRRSGAGQSLTS